MSCKVVFCSANTDKFYSPSKVEMNRIEMQEKSEFKYNRSLLKIEFRRRSTET